MTTRDLYITIAGDDAIAGPIIVSAAYFPKPITNNYLIQEYESSRRMNQIDFLWFDLIVEELVEEEKILLLTSNILENRFRTQIPRRRLIRTKVELLIGEFLSLGATDLNVYYLGRLIPASPYYKGSRILNQKDCIESFITYQLGYSLFRQRLTRFPSRISINKYQWYSNFGHATNNHLYRIYRHGPELPIHREEAVYYIGQHWYRAYKNNEWWALTNPVPPPWWYRLFPHEDILHFLPEEEREEINLSFLRSEGLDPKFWSFLQSNLPSFVTDTQISYERRKKYHEKKRLKKSLFNIKQFRQYLKQKSENFGKLYERLSRKLDSNSS